MQAAALILNLIFYLLFPLLDGPVWCKDSLSYTTMDYSREPLYPLFLKILRTLFGQEDPAAGLFYRGQQAYLLAAVLLQSLLAAVTVWILFRTLYSFGKNRKTSLLYAIPGNLSMWGVQLLNRFGAARGSTYEESIMTEGLGISLYILFILSLVRYERFHKEKDLVLTGLFMFLCISLRKQLLVTVIIFMGVIFVTELLLHGRWKVFAAALLVSAAAFFASNLFDCAYNLAFHGRLAPHTGNAMGIDCVLFYTADEEDIDGIEDAQARELAAAIYEKAKEQHLLYTDTPEDAGWVRQAADFADAYDVIGYDIMNPVIDEYLWENRPDLEGMDFYREIDRIETNIRNGLLKQDKGRILRLWSYNFRKGFVNSVLKIHPVLNMAAFVLFCLYIAMLLLTAARAKKTGETAIPLLAFCVLAGISVNSAVVGLLIFPQTRYMIYNMGLFYSAFFAMAVWIVSERTGTGKGEVAP